MTEQISGETIERRPKDAQEAEPAALEHEAAPASMEAGGLDLAEAPATAPASTPADPVSEPVATASEPPKAAEDAPPPASGEAEKPAEAAAKSEEAPAEPVPVTPPSLDKAPLIITAAPAAAAAAGASADLSAVRPGGPEAPRAAAPAPDPLLAALDRTRAAAAEPVIPELADIRPAPKRRWVGFAAAGIAALLLTGAGVTYILGSGARTQNLRAAQARTTPAAEQPAPAAPVRDVSPVNTAAAETPVAPAVTSEQFAALEQRLAKLQQRLEAIEARGERTAAAPSAATSPVTDARMDRLEREQTRRAEDLAGRLDRLERAVNTAAAPAAASTAAVAAARPAEAKPAETAARADEAAVQTASASAAPVSLAPSSPVPPALPQPRPAQLLASAGAPDGLNGTIDGTRPPERQRIPGFAVRDVGRGAAVIETAEGALFEVYVGETVPGMGRIESVERRGMTMMVTTSRGVVMGMR